MVARGRTASTAGAGASRSSSSSTGSSSSSTSSGSSSASTSSSSKGSTSSSGGAGAARSSRSSSSVSVSSPTASKTVTTTKTTVPSTTTAPAKITTTTTATPKTAIPVSTDLARAITESQAKYPDAWEKATGTSNIQQQFEQVTGTTISAIEQIEEPFIPEILPEVFAEEQKVLADDIQQILSDIDAGLVQVPDWFHNNIEWVQSGHITEQEFRSAYNQQIDMGNIHLLEQKETWWVIRPSGLIEQVTVTQKFVDTMTAQGWIFSKDKPTIEEPQNQNISIVFYIGKGGDLKTHFGINSIIVTPDEAEQLAGWLYSNYNTKILFVMNRLTNDIRTHTVQQLKDMIIQKLKDDKDDSDDIDDDDIKKPQELGFMAMGITGAIALLIGIGLILPDRVGRKK